MIAPTSETGTTTVGESIALPLNILKPHEPKTPVSKAPPEGELAPKATEGVCV